MKDWLIWLVSRLLRGKLSATQRNHLVMHILAVESALPLHATIRSSDEGLLINGKPVDLDKAKKLRELAGVVIDNQAFKLCAEQVRYVAVHNGLRTGLPPEDLLFYRAALWYSEQLDSHLALLAQRNLVTQLGG